MTILPLGVNLWTLKLSGIVVISRKLVVGYGRVIALVKVMVKYGTTLNFAMLMFYRGYLLLAKFLRITLFATNVIILRA